MARLSFDAPSNDQAARLPQQGSAQGSGNFSETGTAPSLSPVQVPIAGRPYSGPDDAAVTLVEFTDYQCPFCARYFRQTLPSILSEYGDRIKYVVFNYPIPSLHPFAHKAAEAAECAYDQGKFWEYHDLLFNNQQSLGSESLKQYALDLELDTGTFDSCLDSAAKAEQVLADFQIGQDLGITGTPTFFINGTRMVGAQPFSSFQAAIEVALGN